MLPSVIEGQERGLESCFPEYQAHDPQHFIGYADTAVIQPVLVLKPDCPDEVHVSDENRNAGMALKCMDAVA